MSDLTRLEFQIALETACETRGWQIPTERRLGLLREMRVLPPARTVHEKGRRGTRTFYPSDTVDLYIQSEESRIASGGHVHSWADVQKAQAARALLAWLESATGTSVPRAALEIGAGYYRESIKTLPLGDMILASIDAPLVLTNRVILHDEDRAMENRHKLVNEVLGRPSETPFENTVEAILNGLIFQNPDGTSANDDEETASKAARFFNPLTFAGSNLDETLSLIRQVATSPKAFVEQCTDEDLLAGRPVASAMLSVGKHLASCADSLDSILALNPGYPVSFAFGTLARSARNIQIYLRDASIETKPFTLASLIVIVALHPSKHAEMQKALTETIRFLGEIGRLTAQPKALQRKLVAEYFHRQAVRKPKIDEKSRRLAGL